MKKIEALTISEALLEASKHLKVSISEIEYEIIQEPSKGFLGVGKKNAIIVASIKETIFIQKTVVSESEAQANKPQKHNVEHEHYKQDLIAKKEVANQTHQSTCLSEAEDSIYDNFFQETSDSYTKETKEIQEDKSAILDKKDDVQYHATTHSHIIRHELYNINEIAKEVQAELVELFALTPFRIDTIDVVPFDNQTLFIELQGDDSALLIGKEGYRYKALSYMLFNWISMRYGLMIRLEIAEFLKNQEEMIKSYLAPIIESIKLIGKGQTKTLDGVLAYIALRQLRAEFPDKYVSFRNGNDGEKYVIVN